MMLTFERGLTWYMGSVIVGFLATVVFFAFASENRTDRGCTTVVAILGAAVIWPLVLSGLLVTAFWDWTFYWRMTRQQRAEYRARKRRGR
jgi:hypothetical protein